MINLLLTSRLKYMKSSSSPAVVRIQASDVALPIATRSRTLVAFCGQIDEQISILLIVKAGRGRDRSRRACRAGRTCAAPPTPGTHPVSDLKEKIKNAGRLRGPTDNFSFERSGAVLRRPALRSDPFLLHDVNLKCAIRGNLHTLVHYIRR